MKKIYIPLLLTVVFGGSLLISASQGVAKIQQKDRTGSPVSTENCTKCHNSNINFSTIPTIRISKNGNPVTEYVPLSEYTVTVDIQSSGSVGHGFQITGLMDDNTFGGLVKSVNEGQKIVLNDRWYFEHSKNETGGSYSMVWIAPPAGSGNVTFYGSALATNGNGKTNGDDYENIPNLVLPEDATNDIADITRKEDLQVYPNPTKSYITVQSSKSLNDISIFDIKGKEVLRSFSNNNKHIVDVNTLSEGIYTLRVGERTTKFIKQ